MRPASAAEASLRSGRPRATASRPLPRAFACLLERCVYVELVDRQFHDGDDRDDDPEGKEADCRRERCPLVAESPAEPAAKLGNENEEAKADTQPERDERRHVGPGLELLATVRHESGRPQDDGEPDRQREPEAAPLVILRIAPLDRHARRIEPETGLLRAELSAIRQADP